MYTSVIIPVYNQSESLRITLNFFNHQTYPTDKFEIIVVDDGSSDGLLEKVKEESWPILKCNVKYIRQENQGRAIARNNGVNYAKGELLLFCDADRFPGKNFIKDHVENNTEYPGYIFIGCPWDYFGTVKNLQKTEKELDWNNIFKYSRKPGYYSKVSKIYNESGFTESGITWATFLVGNSSLRIKEFWDVGGFDPDFKSWGFEHFELAFRLQKYGMKFRNCPSIGNYHIPHPRETGYYRTMIENSIKLFKSKHPEYSIQLLEKFLFGQLSLQEFEIGFNGMVSPNIVDQEPIFYITK